MVMLAVRVQRRTDAKKELERIVETVAVVAVERIGPIVDSELSAETYVEAFPV
jgi:hypothetical protein